MEMSSRGNLEARRRRILLGYNLPWILWTVYALVQPELGALGRWPCPIRTAIGWCFGCGLTSAYGRFLRGEGLPDWRLGIVLAAFAVNAIWSVARAQSLLVAVSRCNQTGPRGRILPVPQRPDFE